jgi:hypothetical protein
MTMKRKVDVDSRQKMAETSALPIRAHTTTFQGGTQTKILNRFQVGDDGLVRTFALKELFRLKILTKVDQVSRRHLCGQ